MYDIHVSPGMHVPLYICGVQRTTFGTWFSFSILDSSRNQTQVVGFAQSLLAEPSRQLFLLLLFLIIFVFENGFTK